MREAMRTGAFERASQCRPGALSVYGDQCCGHKVRLLPYDSRKLPRHTHQYPWLLYGTYRLSFGEPVLGEGAASKGE